MIDEIFKHAADEAPRECCGLVIEDGDNKKYIPQFFNFSIKLFVRMFVHFM